SYAVSSNLGTLYFIRGKYADAARMYETALELNDHDYVVWGNLASAYYWAPGERDKAAETYRRAITLAEQKQ
ncbi:MAG: tetratricopeptide repeat protein, partial [Aliifodinibius sp.]|nr:tetratricopeptide repeat protein [Fodinibius sp.]